MIHRHIDEFRIAEMILPVRHREIQTLDDAVDIVGGVMCQPVDADAFDQRQRLLQRRSLAPWAAGDQFMAAPVSPHHGFDGGAVLRHVGHRQVAAFLLLVPHNLPRDVAAIEGAMGGVQPGDPVGSGGEVLIDHILDRPRQIGLHEFLARTRHAAIGQEDGGVGGPAAVFVLVRGDRCRQQRVDGESLGREARGWGGNVGEAHRAVPP